MDNKKNPSCPLCSLKKSSRMIILALIVAALAIFGLSRMAEDEPGNNAPEISAPAENGSSNEVSQIVLNPAEVAGAEIIATNIQSLTLTELDGRTYRTLVLTPQASWQGDFTAQRIAATLLHAAKSHLEAVDAVNVYLLPRELETETLFDTAALGRLKIYPAEPGESELAVQTRGYLPQELDFIALWDKLRPDFLVDGEVDHTGLTEAVIEKLGSGAYGMSYPLLKAQEVKNLPEVLAAVGIG